MTTKKSSSTKSTKPQSAAKTAAGTSPVRTTGARPSEEEIARSAYSLWEREGRPNGRDTVHWFQAEAKYHKNAS